MVQMLRNAGNFIARIFGRPAIEANPPNIRPEFDATFERLMKEHEGLWQELAK